MRLRAVRGVRQNKLFLAKKMNYNLKFKDDKTRTSVDPLVERLYSAALRRSNLFPARKVTRTFKKRGLRAVYKAIWTSPEVFCTIRLT